MQKALADTKGFSAQADGTRDSGNSENELYLALSFDANSNDRRI